MPLKPSIGDIHAFLRSKDAFIAHFSGAPPGVSAGAGHNYPQDLHHVITGGASTGLACSLVTPTDIFAGGAERNAFGCIGVIVGLKDEHSLMAVSHGDAGSYMVNGVRTYPDKNISIRDCEQSLSLRTSGHNEWGIRDAQVLGILAIHPFDTWDPRAQGGHGDIARTTLAQVIAEFAGLPIVTLAANKWLQVSTSASFYPS